VPAADPAPGEARAANPWVFVVGCPRSGTTLLQRMLDAHPQLAVANDTHFITRAAKKVLRDDPFPPLTAELVEQVGAYRRFHRMGLDAGEVRAAAADSRSYAGFVRRLYSIRGEKTGKRLSGEKTPDYCRQMTVLHGLFPSTRFVHIIRDGRDTALSALNWATPGKGPGRWSLWADDPLACCALWWRWQVGTGLRQAGLLPRDRYHELRYEALVADPEGTLRPLADFLDIPWTSKMLRFHEGRTRRKPGLSAKSAWLPATSGLRDWRRDMREEDVAVFEALAGDLLAELGYGLSSLAAGRSALERAQRCLDWWREQPIAAR